MEKVYTVVHGRINEYLFIKETPKGVQVMPLSGSVKFFRQDGKVFSRPLGNPIEYYTQRVLYTHGEAVRVACSQIECFKNHLLGEIAGLDERINEMRGLQ